MHRKPVHNLELDILDQGKVHSNPSVPSFDHNRELMNKICVHMSHADVFQVVSASRAVKAARLMARSTAPFHAHFVQVLSLNP